MTKKEKQFIAKLLKMASNEFSNHGCNDLEEELVNHFTKKEWSDLNLKMNQWNEHTDTPQEDTHMQGYDWLCMSYFAHVLEIEEDDNKRPNMKYMDDDFLDKYVSRDREGNAVPIQSQKTSGPGEFTTYDSSGGHCGLCGSITCNGGCFK